MQLISKYRYAILFLTATLVHIIGIFNVNLMDIDAAQYASICLETLNSGDFLHITNHYRDYLDKPPLLFWLGAISYKIFGVYDWSYRIPSFLVTLLGVYSTYRLGKLFYNKQTGLNAALIIYTSQAIFFINHDVRTDTILTGMVIFSSWQLAEFLLSNRFIYIMGGFTGIGLAMLQKGPIGMVVPVMSIASYIIIKREFRLIFKWQWVAGSFITVLILAPMLLGLYEQFDLHPEKTVNGQTGVSGLRFFFWEQSFGRITGESPWRNDLTPFFFTHTFLWSFLPWSVFAVIALFINLAELFRSKFRNPGREYFTTGGFLIAFAALSFSHYKLPHYIFVTYPFAAIFTSAWLNSLDEKGRIFSILNPVQSGTCLLLLGGAIVVNTWFFPITDFPVIIGLAVLLFAFLVSVYLAVPRRSAPGLITLSALTIVFINFLMNVNFYPQLLKYQAGSEIGKYVKTKNPTAANCFSLLDGSYALDVYSGVIWHNATADTIRAALKSNHGLWIYTTPEGYAELVANNFRIEEFKKYPAYHVTTLTLPFLIPSSRQKELKEKFLVYIVN